MGEVCCTLIGLVIMLLLVAVLFWVTTLPADDLESNVSMNDIWLGIVFCLLVMLTWVVALCVMSGLYNAVCTNNFEKTRAGLKKVVVLYICGFILMLV